MRGVFVCGNPQGARTGPAHGPVRAILAMFACMGPVNGPIRALTPDHPLAPRNSGEQAGRGRAADEGEDGDDRDGEPDRQEGRGGVSADDQARDRRKEQQVHQVHAERAFGQGGDEPRRGLAADAGEHEEQAEGRQQDVGRAELPRPLKNRCFDELARGTLPPEGPAGKGCADEKADPSDDEFALPGPIHVIMDIMGQHQISQVSGTIPQRRETIPEALAPEFVRDETVDPGNEGRQDKEPEEDALLLRGRFFQPGRYDRNDQVDADERVHEPEVSAHRREVEGQALQVGKGLLPGHPAPRQWQESVDEHERQHRRKDAQKAAAIELHHSLAGFHRHQQEGRHDHKERHAGPADETVVESHPKAVPLIGQQGDIAGQPGSIGRIEVLAGMNQHHQ